SDRLVLTSSYAYQIRNTTTNELRIGEGLVGQAAREKKSILFTAIPDDHVPLTINSGLGEYKARCIVATPLLYSDRLFGVIALGTAGEFTEAQLEFLNLVSENIGISLNSALARTEMQELLAESRRQAEELQSQQEALRVANEELEEQTKALTESQHRLQTQRKELTSSNEKLELQKRTLEEQQEELRVINEELETQTQALEVQSAATETQNLELEQARQSLEEKATALETASKYKSEFLANMSHELRTPLNSLLILAELLKENERGHLSEKEVGFAETIHNSGTELLNLINDVLDLAKVESGKMEVHPGDVPLDELAQYVGYNFQHQAEEKGLTLVVENDDDVPDLIFTDYQKVLQIIKNLLSNAVKFTDQGSISFRISRPDAKADFSDVSLDPENAIAMTVSDTGVGIPQDKWDSVFEAFQQADGSTSRKYGGTGLGLSISRELAKNLGGKLTLQSEKGEGSTFILYLPLRFESTPRSAVSPSDRAEPLESRKELRELSGEQTEQEVETDSARQAVHHQPAKDERENVSPGQPSIGDRLLLIIEDDPQFAKIVLDLAQEKGFNGLIAEDGEIGLQMARDLKPLAIILDIGLPKMDGWMVMEKLKTTAETRHIPVHFISAMDKDIRAMKMGAIGFLTKPISRRDLEDAFSKIEATIAQKVKRLLIVEDDQTLRKSMVALIENMDVHIDAVSSGEEAYQLLGSQDFDCLVLDLGLRDMSGLDLLEKINNRGSLVSLPVIIYTGKELSEEEERQLMAYSDSIIIKGAGSMERLLGEMTLFLHQVETDLPSEQQRMLQKAYDKDQVLNGKVVLLVDDDVRSSFALSNRLEASNIKVVRAFDGEEALKSLDDQPEVDLVLMDVMMPTMDGYETMREIRKQDRFRKLPIIALTAKAMKDDRDKCLEAGANDYLPKPIDTVKLISLLRVWLF
ncbi:MAG: response regulator, partial [Proteobacteria bacterium]|nr:response regulator [Pseudomonadota bacterium]